MKWYHALLTITVVAVAAMGISLSLRPGAVGGDYFYKIETGGAQSGYAVLDTSLVLVDGVRLIRLEQVTNSRLTLLGSDVDSEVRLVYLLDPETRRVRSTQVDIDNGTLAVSWGAVIEGRQARCTSSLKEDDVVLDLPPDVIVENTLYFDHLLAGFLGDGLEERTYKTLSVADQEIQRVRCSKQGTETIELAGNEYNTLVVDNLNLDTGDLTRMWIDTKTAMIVKLLQQDGSVVSLADESVVHKVGRVDMDKYIMTQSDVAIADVPGITYMKVKAKMRPTGAWLDSEMLTVPGQTFTGTVKDNLVEGVFEIEHARYDGADAPPFPPDFSGDPDLRGCLVADGVFESDDPVLVEKAQELTKGSADSWEAARRLSDWVSKEIGYAIPGGGTARRTYDIRAGECGAHSVLLATFCRAVGIPSRMVWGCMYTPNAGGAFGQHGWTEVYMGDAGWIPVDATVGECDFVDSGHIRVAAFSSVGLRLNAKEFEILDYRVGDATAERTGAPPPEYDDYIGKYDYPGSSDPFEVLVMDGSLVLDVPSRALLALKDPDDKGRWYAKMADRVYVTFQRDEVGQVLSFSLHEVFSMPRKSAPERIDDDVPEEVRPYLGVYTLAAANADFSVSYSDERLMLHHSLKRRHYNLKRNDVDGGWSTGNREYTLYFEPDDEGVVSSIRVDSGNEFRKR
jgi:predicted metal-dependent HD superfamily phosphohydrolase